MHVAAWRKGLRILSENIRDSFSAVKPTDEYAKSLKRHKTSIIYCEDPPEMVSTWPLTQPPSSLARKATTLATSSGTAHLPSGQWFAINVSIFSAGQSGDPPGM